MSASICANIDCRQTPSLTLQPTDGSHALQVQGPLQLQNLPPDLRQLLLATLTLHELYIRRNIDGQFFIAYHSRCTRLWAQLVREARALFPDQLLRTLSLLTCRGFTEWQDPPPGDDFQYAAFLRFEGEGSELTFPECHFRINPNGSVSPPELLPPGLAYFNSSTVVDGAPFNWDDKETPLRATNAISIRLGDGAQSIMRIRIMGGHPATITIDMSPTPLTAYRAFCGVVIFLFFNASSALLNPPQMLRQSELRLCLRRFNNPQNLPGELLNMPAEVRDALAIVMLRLESSGLVPNSRLVLADDLMMQDVLHRVFY
jgi:hypothetical protein